MPKEPRIKGAPPKTLTGQVSVSSVDSPWWDQVASEITSRPGMVGKVVSIEELTQTLPDYPDGRRPRAKAASRRLRKILELVERGPNGSRSRGATYRIVDLDMPEVVVPDDDVPKDQNDDYLEQAIRRMTDG